MRLDDIEPSERAREIAGDDQDPRRIEAILQEAKRVVRVRKPLVIAETRHGFICAALPIGRRSSRSWEGPARARARW